MNKNNYNGDCYYGLVVETYNKFHPQENINDGDFYKKLIDEIDGTVLEMMCGSGRVLIPLLRQNIDIDGLDCSSEMLESCREQVLEEGLNCNLYEQYAHEMELPRKYKTIIFSYSSFALIIDRNQAFETLHRIYNHLEDDGQLILDMAIPWFSAKEQADAGIWKLSRKGFLSNNRLVHISKASEYNLLEQLEYSQIKYEVYQDDKLIDTLVDEMHCRYYGKYELELLLEKAGFCKISTYGDFQDKQASEGDEVVTFRCLKT